MVLLFVIILAAASNLFIFVLLFLPNRIKYSSKRKAVIDDFKQSSECRVYRMHCKAHIHICEQICKG